MGGGAIKTCQITSLTLSKSFNTWLFQNRNTLNPRASSEAVRFASEADCSKCCPPSTSTINFLSRQTKSTIYGPKGCCRRNLCPSTWRRRRCFHNTFSASVGLFLNFLACPRFIPPTFILPLKGGGKTSLALARLSLVARREPLGRTTGPLVVGRESFSEPP